MKRLFRLFMAFLRRDFLVRWSYKVGFLYELGSLLSGLITLYFVGRMMAGHTPPAVRLYHTDYFTFSLIGVAFVDYMFVSMRTFASNMRVAQVLGTLEAMLMTPADPVEIVFFSATYPYITTLVRSVLVLLLGLAFGARFGSVNILSTIAFILLTLLVFTGMGLLSAAITLYIKQSEPVSALFAGLSFLLGGILYPVQSLPHWVQTISWTLPMTHAVEGLRRSLLFGDSIAKLGYHLLFLGAWAIVLFPLGLYSIRLVVNRLARQGSFGEY